MSSSGFAAAKHVRTERDPVSVLQMLNVNINGTLRSVEAVMSGNPEARVFVVSTDKAADPASLMGASKRLMEMVILGSYPQATTTRFANVAFSSGSLLESWLLRLARRQVLPVPADTRRFFVSPQESGQLCAIASAAPPGGVVVPEPGLIGSVDLLDALLAGSGLPRGEGVSHRRDVGQGGGRRLHCSRRRLAGAADTTGHRG